MTRPHHPRRQAIARRSSSVLLAACAALAAAACGDDGASSADPAATGAEAGGLAAYCDGQIALDQVFQDTDADDPETFAASLQAGGRVLDQLVEDAPSEIAEPLATLVAAFAEVRASSDPAAFFTEEVQAADAEVHAFDVEQCGWAVVEVTAEDYRFAGPFPSTPGPFSFELRNTGTEPHVMVVARKLDAVEGMALEAFTALDAEEDLPASFEVEASAFVEPGDADFALVDLPTGDYVAFCPIPVGTTMENGGEVDGPPHFTQGMVTAFTVG